MDKCGRDVIPLLTHCSYVAFALTHWGRVTHIRVGKLTNIGSDNGLSPGRRQAITWTNVEILLIGPLGTHFSEMLIECHTFSFKKIHLKISSGKWRHFCLGLNVLTHNGLVTPYNYIEPGQQYLSQWLVASGYQAITWNNADLSTEICVTVVQSQIARHMQLPK